VTSTPVTVNVNAAVVIDQPGTATISGPATSLTSETSVTLSVAANDPDIIASWIITSKRYRINNDEIPGTFQTHASGNGSPPVSNTVIISGASGTYYIYTIEITDTR
jgi:hypothetical protein